MCSTITGKVEREAHRAHRLASLAEMVSYRFSKRHCLKIIKIMVILKNEVEDY